MTKREVEHTGISVQGILNSSQLSLIIGFDLIGSISIHYMHAVPEGFGCTMIDEQLKH